MGKFVFIADSKCFELEVTGNNERETIENTYIVLSPFVTSVDEESDVASVECFQRNTNELRKKIHELVDVVKSINPIICRLSDYFEKELKPNEWFYIAIDKELPFDECDQIMLTIKNIEATEDEKKLNDAVGVTLHNLHKVYSIHTFNGKASSRIGEPDKQKRVCRYCHKSMPETTFKEIAHTISEALGNKSIITNDECDICNHFFGCGIEQDFISIFDLPRLLFDVRGRRGTHKFVGENYILGKGSTGELDIHYTMKNGEKVSADLPQYMQLLPNRKFPPQNIYKALCKYAMGVLDSETLSHFDRTRRWLMGETEEICLPKIARFTHPHVFQHPQILVFIRHDDNRKELPHVVVELHIMDLVFIYVLPFSDKDDCDFTEEGAYETFWSFFEIYNQHPGWRFSDYSSQIPDYPKIALNFKQSE